MKTKKGVIGILITAAVFTAAFVLVLFGISRAGAARDSEALRVTEESLHRAMMSCYAIEGRYPETLDYLTENYGVYINPDKYAVYYDAFASNIMPDITVIKKVRGAE